MKLSALEKLRYPIGKFSPPENITQTQIDTWIDALRTFPDQLEEAILGLPDGDLSLIYRPGGWNIRQLVHHCADSHANAWIRFRLALTESVPTISPYDEQAWSLLPDNQEMDTSHSTVLLKAIHARWTYLLTRLQSQDWEREYFHPANGEKVSLQNALGMYVWHGQHHLAHIYQALRFREQFPEE